MNKNFVEHLTVSGSPLPAANKAVIADHVKGVISFRASPDERPVRLTKLGADDKLERTTEGAVNGTTFDLAGAVQRANALE